MKIERNFLRNHLAESALFARRSLVAFFGMALLTSVLVVNLYRLQILDCEDYRVQSNKNRIKIVPIAPSRGIIYDRNGNPLALNRTTYQLVLIPEQIVNLRQTITDLCPIVNLTNCDITHFEKERKHSLPFNSLIIKNTLTDVQQARFAVNQHRFPGVRVRAQQSRYYPYGSAFTHVVGYVSKINERDLECLTKQGLLSNYSATHNIGQVGIERYYENVLHGETGYEEVEINNRGHIVRQLHKKTPQAGKNIYLTLDLNLQKYVWHLVSKNRAAVVVIDPRDGSVRALVSSPSYDPNLFVNGISIKNYNNLLQDKNHPFINRTTQGLYPPASTVKPYISLSALTLVIINKNSLLFDPGWWKLPGSEKRYHDWKRWGHGQLNVTRALEESADTFFYQIAHDMGIDRLSEWMKKFGYGQHTGIDLYEEYTGVMPTRAWKATRFKQPWYQGDTISVGIGQGYWTATPIQMSKALITLINDGAVRTPHILYSIQEKNKNILYHPLKRQQIGDPESGHWEIVKDGMYGVANRPNGTANKSFSDAPYKVAAKSGTAQVYGLKNSEIYNVHNISERLRDHKLMTAFAPYHNPTVGVVVVLENGSTNLEVGTITRQILDYVLLVNHHAFDKQISSQSETKEKDCEQ